MSLAVRATINLVVVLIEPHATMRAGETVRVEFLLAIRGEILAFNAAIALAAQRAIQLVVVLSTVGGVIVDVEFSR